MERRISPSCGGFSQLQKVAIANEASDRDTLYLYPRRTKNQNAVVYHCNKTGKRQLYM
jgi:hypothetical protein